eukprot:GHRR01036358.1.p1 GENE.GHRR01036358.1~~GHRR01036358.1.p1  ORF type:complete len:101 (-),score=23.16 GHRR01036358.1:162-464(-)
MLVVAAGVVGEQVQQTVDDRSLPAWVWFMWIPQLLTSLTRPEVHRVKPILKQLAEVCVMQPTRNRVAYCSELAPFQLGSHHTCADLTGHCQIFLPAFSQQ